MGGRNATLWQGYEHQLFADGKPQTVAIENSEEKDATSIYRCLESKDGLLGFLKTVVSEDSKEEEPVDSGWKIFLMGALKNKESEAVGYRPWIDETNTSKRGIYKWDKYGEVMADVKNIATGLASFELGEKANIGLFSLNRPEWFYAHLANWSQNYRTVALYDTLGAHAVEYIVSHAELPVIFVEKDKLPKLWAAIENDKKQESAGKLVLKYVIQFDYQEKFGNKHENISPGDLDKAKELGVTLLGLTELQQRSKEPFKAQPAKPDDLAYIMYTSGTTGDPKGVMITHQAFASVVASVYRRSQQLEKPFGSHDLHVSYLPLAHSLESAVITVLMSVGARVAFYQGDIRKIGDDWKELEPTVMIGVPRIFNKTYEKIKSKMKENGGVRKWIFDKAENSGKEKVREGEYSKWYDEYVWKTVRTEMGYSRVRFLATGAAPIPPNILEFVRVLCGPQCVVTQGYGLTESMAVSFLTNFKDYTVGHTGAPVDNIEFRLVSAPECEYFVTDKPYPRGEVQLRGPTIMQGYFKDEQATSKALTADKWLCTGDIGRINPNGTLSIVDRRKNLFKTCQGEYIAAEKIEGAYSVCESIGQMWIYGNSYKSFIVAVVVPNALWALRLWQERQEWAYSEDLKPGTNEFAQKWSEIAEKKKEELKELIKKDMSSLQAGLEKFELVKDIMLECQIDSLLQGFTVDNDTLTPSFKLKRPQLLKKYRDQLRQLYAQNGEEPKDDEKW